MVKVAPEVTSAPGYVGLRRPRVIQTKHRKPRSKVGLAEAKAATKMTKEQWQKHQVGMKKKWPAPSYMALPGPDPTRQSHTCYRDETYAFITRWHEGTKISYRPHAKAPGSKSHVRYEKYSKARTVAQALKLGSWPQDWCWDYERGFIKVHGPVRDEPIDPALVADESQLTDVDTAIWRWHIRELARNFGLDYTDLYVDKASGETSLLRAHRLVAEREAQKRLSAAEKGGRRVSDEDMTETLSRWAFGKNFARTNVLPDGREWVWSDNIGLTRDRLGSIHITAVTLRYPSVLRLMVQWLTERLPPECRDFTFTSLNLNCNYAARRHRDGNNFGPSMISAFGDFSGGELNYWPEDDKSQRLEDLPDGKQQRMKLGQGLALFNGNSAHSVEDFKGSRFSVVYFTLGCFDRADEKDRNTLRALGIPYPPKGVDPYTFLRAPRGYGSQRALATPARSSSAGAEKMPSWRYWTRQQLEGHRLKRKNSAEANKLIQRLHSEGAGKTSQAKRDPSWASRKVQKKPAAAQS